MSHLRTILPYFEPYRRGVLIGLFLVVVANVFTIAAPYLLKLAIDGFDDPEVTRSSVIVYAILIVAAAVLGGAARYGMRELLNGNQQTHRVRFARRFLPPPHAPRRVLLQQEPYRRHHEPGDERHARRTNGHGAGHHVFGEHDRRIQLRPRAHDLDQPSLNALGIDSDGDSAAGRVRFRAHHPSQVRADPRTVLDLVHDGPGEPHRRTDRPRLRPGRSSGSRVRSVEPRIHGAQHEPGGAQWGCSTRPWDS